MKNVGWKKPKNNMAIYIFSFNVTSMSHNEYITEYIRGVSSVIAQYRKHSSQICLLCAKGTLNSLN